MSVNESSGLPSHLRPMRSRAEIVELCEAIERAHVILAAIPYRSAEQEKTLQDMIMIGSTIWWVLQKGRGNAFQRLVEWVREEAKRGK